MTPHQYQAYARYITFLPTPTVCTSRAIVFLSINSKIAYHHRRLFDAAPFCLLSNNPCDQRFCRHDENCVTWNYISTNHIRFLLIVNVQLYFPYVAPISGYFCYAFTGVLSIDCAIKSEPFAKSRGFEKLIHNLFSSPILREYHLNHSNRRMECVIYWKKINDSFDVCPIIMIMAIDM